jgi:A/G-specific adenine glycosylase
MRNKDINQLQKRLNHWYQNHHRMLPWRETDDPYRIWVSEVMLQQTQIKTVLPYYKEFLIHFPNVQRLASAKLQGVLKVWEGLGYYARARNLHRAAKKILVDHNGKVPDTWETIRKLPGVGDYIAAAVLSIAYHQPFAVVDGNVKRVLSRLHKFEEPVNRSSSYKTFKAASERLLDRRRSGIFNQAMMELGATCCIPKKPACDICPIQRFCRAFQDGTVAEYPKRKNNPPIPLHHISVGVVYKNGHMLITRRKLEGLLGGLWEFPGGKIGKGESPESACVREIREEVNLKVEIDSHITRVKHAYTHFKVHLDVFACRYISGKVKLNGPIDHRWITWAEIDRFPFPKANHKFIPLLNPTKKSIPSTDHTADKNRR